jgi:hypothetical protein
MALPVLPKKRRKRLLVAMIAAVKSRIGARLWSGPSWLNSAPISGIGRATPSLALRINMPSSPWLREKAVSQ